MRRGDLVWVDFNPARGSEANKRRPAIVVSNDGANRSAESTGRGVVTVVPVTSYTAHVYPFQILLPARSCGLPRASKAQAEQVRPVAVERVSSVIGHLASELADQLDRALRLHLNL
jgi:mRNA interferase MazF